MSAPLKGKASPGFARGSASSITPELRLFLLCASFEDDLGITVCRPRETRREKRASGLMAHGKIDRSKQERESWDVTYGLHTQSIREGPKRCLCQSDGCTLSNASPPWEGMRCHPPSWPYFSTVALKASHSSCVATKSIRSSQLLPVGADVFNAEAGFTYPRLGGCQLLLSNHARNLCGSKSHTEVREMLPSACSKHQGCCRLLYPTRHQCTALTATGSGR